MATPLLDAEIDGIMIAASQQYEKEEAEELEDQILLQASQLYEVEKQAIAEEEEDAILLQVVSNIKSSGVRESGMPSKTCQ